MYSKMKKKELEEECEKRKIDHKGMNRKGMIARLREHEEVEESENEESEVEAGDEGGGVGASVGDGSENDMRLKLLHAEKERSLAEERRLKMELEIMREKAQLGMIQPIASAPAGSDSAFLPGQARLPSQADGEDLIGYLHSFERVAILNGIDEGRWARLLPALLNSDMRAYYNRLSLDVCKSYTDTKQSLLNACRMDSQYYLTKFQNMRRSGRQSYRQCLDQLNDVYSYYLEARQIETFEELRDSIVMERLKETLPNETKFFVSTRHPSTAAQLSDYADLHFACTLEAKRNSSGNEGGQKPNNHSNDQYGKPWQQKPYSQHMNVGTYGVQDGSAGETPVRFSQHTNKQTYYNGHNIPWSQNNVRLVQPGLNLDKVNDYMKRFVVPVFVNGRPADAIRDSAADYCLIHPRVVQGIPCVIGSKTRIQCALGIVRTIPTCKINISSPRFENGREFQVTAGIVDGLPYDVILGSNLYIENPTLLDIIGTYKDYDRKERAQTETRKNEQTNIRQSPRDRRTETPLPVKAALIAISDESQGDGTIIHGKTINDSHKERTMKGAEGATGADKRRSPADYDDGRESHNENGNDNDFNRASDNRKTLKVSHLPMKQIVVDKRRLGDYALATKTINRQMQTAGQKGTLGNFGRRTNKEGVGVNRGRPRKNWDVMVGAGKEQMGHRESSQRSDQSNWRDKLLTETRYNGRDTCRRYQRNGP